MKTYLSKHSGFCFGVNRAIEKINRINKNGVYVFGKLIHNPQVVEELEQKGVKIVEDINKINKGKVVITAHGVSDNIIAKLKNKNVKIIDTTCPYVKKVHTITKDLEKKGYKIVILGDKEHTEVKGIIGNLKNYLVINNTNEINNINPNEKIALVSQTTQSLRKFNNISAKLKFKVRDIKIINTICSATIERQNSAKELAKKADLMLVIGGYNSANTRRLYEICNNITESKYIETAADLKPEWFKGKEKIGITAGASTPDKIIRDVIERIKLMENLVYSS
jgi:4-hydroxy-3-methylbut-2-enyl diphosphate reductase